MFFDPPYFNEHAWGWYAWIHNRDHTTYSNRLRNCRYNTTGFRLVRNKY